MSCPLGGSVLPKNCVSAEIGVHPHRSTVPSTIAGTHLNLPIMSESIDNPFDVGQGRLGVIRGRTPNSRDLIYNCAVISRCFVKVAVSAVALLIPLQLSFGQSPAQR